VVAAVTHRVLGGALPGRGVPTTVSGLVPVLTQIRG